MSITVKKLNKIKNISKYFDLVIKEQLEVIDEKIKNMNIIWGENTVTHILPSKHILYRRIPKRDMQLVVYSAIIRNLEERGFRVEILLNESNAILYIRWDMRMKDKEIKEMEELINGHLKVAPHK